MNTETGVIENLNDSNQNNNDTPFEKHLQKTIDPKSFCSISTLEKTNNLKSEIYNMVQEIVDEQNSNLNQYRKEGHLYFVCEEIKEKRFLRDITENSKYEFEEVNIPEELLDKATEGTILKFTNGKYEFYSENGYDLTE